MADGPTSNGDGATRRASAGRRSAGARRVQVGVASVASVRYRVRSTSSTVGPVRVSSADRGRSADERPDEHADEAGLDHAPVVGAGVGELLGRQPERDRAALAGLEADAPEPAQLDDRARDRRLLVADVELDDLLAGARARCW